MRERIPPGTSDDGTRSGVVVRMPEPSPPAATSASAAPSVRQGPLRLFRVVVGVWATLVGVAAAGSLGWPMYKDAPLMGYAASLIRHGARPYRDLFEMNLPGTYVVAIAGQSLFGERALGFRLWDLLLLSGFGWSVWRLTLPFRRTTRVVAVLLPVTYYLAGGPYMALQRDWLVGISTFAAVAVLFERSPRAWRPLAAGALLGLAVTIKPQALLVGAGVLLLCALRAAGAGASGIGTAWPRARARRDLLLLPVGMALPLLGEVAWLWRVGSLGSFVELNRDYVGPLYSRLDGQGLEYAGVIDMVTRVPENVARSTIGGSAPLVVLVGLLAAGTAVLWWRSGPRADARAARVAALVLLSAYGVVHFAAGFRPWTYYWLPFLTAAPVLAALAVELVTMPATRGARRGAVALATGVVAVGLFATVLPLLDPPAELPELTAEVAATDRMTAALDARARPGDRVQVLDTAGGAAAALQRSGLTPATRFMYDFHFFHHIGSAETDRLRAEFIAELRADPPRFVLAPEISWSRRESYDDFGLFPELATFLDGYRIAVDDPDFRLYERQD